MPPLLLEVCVVLGAPDDKVSKVYQVFAYKGSLAQTSQQRSSTTNPLARLGPDVGVASQLDCRL